MISTFEIHAGELRATFLRNHNMRRHKGTTKCPKQKTTQADNSSPEDPHNPDSRHNRHKHGGAAPDKGRCTRYVALHPLRGGAPEQKRCIAYGSGALPQHTRTNAELARRTTHRRTPPCAARPYWRQDGHAAHATTCTPAHSDTLTCEEPVKPPRDEAVVGLSDRGLACCLASGRASRPARISVARRNKTRSCTR